MMINCLEGNNHILQYLIEIGSHGRQAAPTSGTYIVLIRRIMRKTMPKLKESIV
jgi:hypothetical protein